MTSDDATVIARQFEDDYVAAFNRKDARALASLFTEEATIVTEWGDLVAGRAEFERGLTRAFATLAGQLTLETTPAHAALVSDDVIVSHGTARRLNASGADTLVYTRVLVRRGGIWHPAATHVAEPSTQPDPRASSR